MPHDHPDTRSPFEAPARWVTSLPAATIRDMYRRKCGVDVKRFLSGAEQLDLFECTASGMRFWRPASVAGPEELYRVLAKAWPNYYQQSRWEYQHARATIGTGARVLEIGCGRGYFLRSLEHTGNIAVGLELNASAIASKVTTFEVRKQLVDALAPLEAASYDVVCSFQVLEHVVNPASFLRSCIVLLKPRGLLIVSVPNNEYPMHRAMRDAFDLPPHHMNQFTPEICERIAALLQLELVGVRTATVRVPRKPVEVDRGRSPLIRLVQRATNLARRYAAGTMAPGHTLLATYRVRAPVS